MRRATVTAVAVACGMIALAAPASAATIQVGISTDEYGGSASCSLRDAVRAANDNAAFGGCVRSGSGATDTILLESGTDYTRSIDGDSEDANATGDLDITGNTIVKVKGPSEAPAEIDANNMDRVIDVRPGGSLEASHLQITDGQQVFDGSFANARGGGVRVNAEARLELSSSEISGNDATGVGGTGGGLATSGDTTLRQVTISGNDSNSTAGGGGGIDHLDGTLTVLGSTIILNTSAVAGGGISTQSGPGTRFKLVRSTLTQNHSMHPSDVGGGGLYAAGAVGGRRAVVNSTISGNLSNHDGGGVYFLGGEPLKVNATTITDNTADYDETLGGSGGGVGGVAVASYKNSIIADNFNPNAIGNEEDCPPPAYPLNGTNNLIGKDTGCTKPPGTKATADPKLGPLEDNGGPTKTHKLLKASPAIGLASGSAPTKDQRGHARDADPDAGAYER